MTATMAKKPRKLTPWQKALREHRDSMGLTQEQMAARCDLPTRTWISWENGQRKPGRMAQKLLREAFPDLRFPNDS